MLARILLIILWLLSPSVHALVVLQYHHISETTPHSTSISPALFAQHLDYLANNHFNVITLQTLVDHLQTKQPFADKTVLITFDDGYRSVYEKAFPLLKAKNFPFTVFVNTQPIGHNLHQFMNWSELKELLEAQGSVANHSHTHPHFIRHLPNEDEKAWRSRITAEILDAENLIAKNLGSHIKALAYPFGEYNLMSRNLLKSLGFIAFGQQSGAVGIDVDQQSIPRFPFGGDYGQMDDFIVKVNSLPMPLVNLRILGATGEELDSHVLGANETMPQLQLDLSDSNRDLDINCYFSGQGRLKRVQLETAYRFSLNTAVKPGRSRFNCTAPAAGTGRFYWISQPIIRRQTNGDWYVE